MMKTLTIEGEFSREEFNGKVDHVTIKMTSVNLKSLSDAILHYHYDLGPLQILVGQGKIIFDSDNFFSIELSEQYQLFIKGEPSQFKNIARNIGELINAELLDDYLVHMHLDNYLDIAGKEVSDVIFQRIDTFHK